MGSRIASKQVLIVEDNLFTARSLARIVGHQAPVRIAATAGEGARVADTASRLSAVLLDYRLPDGNGIELRSRLRQSRPWLPVLILTGSDDPTIPNRVMAAGAQYATKPLACDHLLSFIQAALDHSADQRYVDALLPASLGLTARQREIATLLLGGHTKAEAAAELGVAESTIKSAVHSILRKCRAPSLRALRRRALHRGN